MKFKQFMSTRASKSLRSFTALRALMVVLVLCLAGLNACKKELVSEAVPDGKTGNLGVSYRGGSELDEKDQLRADFAKVFAKALSNADFRSYLKAKYLSLDQEDKEFVYALYRNDEIGKPLCLLFQKLVLQLEE